jgi:Leucine-rich repeat (LRR) protein
MKTILTLLLTIVSTISFAEVSFSEKDALVSLYNSTNGNQWKTKWNFQSPVSTWFGVKVENDKVIALDLSSNNLSGVLPPSIAQLTYLKSLNLFHNNIEGVIPSEIGFLINLEDLNLSFNKFSGEISNDLCKANKLKKIELFMNRLSGNLPNEINKLNNLEILSLYNNEFTGEIPESLYQLKALKVLQLNSNKFSGNLKPEISNLTSLVNLSLFDNNFKGQLPVVDLEKIITLKEMNISYNNFNGMVSERLAKKDILRLTMVNEQGVASSLKINMEKDKAIATEE